MTSPVMAAPAVPASPIWTSVSGLPVARVAEPDEYGPTLVIGLDAPPGRERPDTVVLRADGEVDMHTVAPLRAALDQALTAGRTVVVDLRGVWFIDCAGIGLLVEARWRARRRRVGLRIVPGRSVARIAALLDLTATLGLDTTPDIDRTA